MGRKIATSRLFRLGLSLAAEDVTVILEKGLDSVALEGNVGKLALDVHGTHDGWRKDDGDV